MKQNTCCKALLALVLSLVMLLGLAVVSCALSPIPRVDAYIPAPVGGDTPSFTVSTHYGEGQYRVKSVGWTGENSTVTAGDRFVTGEEYTVTIVLAPETGYDFSPMTHAMINGAEAEVTQMEDNLSITCTFTALNPITSAEVFVTAPVAGARPDDNIRVPDDANYSYNHTSSWETEDDGTFVEGKNYTVKIWLTANDGYGFSTDVATKMNDNEATVVSNSGRTLVIAYTFTAITPIDSVELGVAVPVAGECPSYTAILSDDANCTVESVTWTGENSTLSADDTFEAEKEYTVTVVLVPDVDYAFADAVTSKINGRDVTAELMSDGKVSVSCDFLVETPAPTNDVYIGGMQVTEGNADDVLGNGKVSYDPATKTLTLNGATLTATDAAAIKATGDLTIALIGVNNTITSTNGSGIEVTGAVTIVGGGTLRVSSTNGNGIEASDDINITGGTVSVTADDDHCGIVSLTSITIGGEDNPTVTVGCKVGLDAPIVTIKNSCTLTITSKECAIATAAPLNFPEGNWYQWTTVENDAMTLSREQAYELDSNDSYLHIESAPLTYTVTFMNGNEEWASILVNAGDTVAFKISGMPAPPAPAGYEFAGWYAGDEQIVPETVVNSDIVAEATWREKTSPPAYYPIYIPTAPQQSPELVTSPETFDSGIATSVVLTLLAATGAAWLGKKKD